MLNDRDLKLGRYALRAAIAGEERAALDTLKKFGENTSIFGIALGWVDAMLMHLTDDELKVATLPPEQSYGAGLILTELEGSGKVEPFQSSPPEVQWVVGFIFARARNDKATATDMWEKQGDDQYARHLWALLMVCSANIRKALENGVTNRSLPPHVESKGIR